MTDTSKVYDATFNKDEWLTPDHPLYNDARLGEPIDMLELMQRTINVLNGGGIKYLWQLLQRDKFFLVISSSAPYGFGPKSYSEVVEVLAMHGLKLDSFPKEKLKAPEKDLALIGGVVHATVTLPVDASWAHVFNDESAWKSVKQNVEIRLGHLAAECVRSNTQKLLGGEPEEVDLTPAQESGKGETFDLIFPPHWDRFKKIIQETLLSKAFHAEAQKVIPEECKATLSRQGAHLQKLADGVPTQPAQP